MQFDKNFFGFNDYSNVVTDINFNATPVAQADIDAAAGANARDITRTDHIDWERSLWDKEVLALTKPDSAVEAALTRLSGHFEMLSVVDQPKTAIRCAKYADGLKSIFIMDLDTLLSTGDAVPKLLHLRRASPGLTTVIMSSHFHHDDTSMERRAIADCSLKLPLGDSELLRGLGYACRNANQRLRGDFFS